MTKSSMLSSIFFRRWRNIYWWALPFNRALHRRAHGRYRHSSLYISGVIYFTVSGPSDHRSFSINSTKQLIDDLFGLAEVQPRGANVLEIGCGTGQATLPLARRGCQVTCLEKGESLARLARAKLVEFPKITVVNARFEDLDPNRAVFDIVFAANAWHWLDPHLRYAKAAQLLRPAGILAFTISRHAFPPGFDSFFAEIQDCYEAVGVARLPWPQPTPDEMPEDRKEIESSVSSMTSTSCAGFTWKNSQPMNTSHLWILPPTTASCRQRTARACSRKCAARSMRDRAALCANTSLPFFMSPGKSLSCRYMGNKLLDSPTR